MIKPGLLMISSGFVASRHNYRGMCQELADRLGESGYRIITSSRAGRVIRPFDMLYTVWRYRNRYNVVLVDVFSGWAFLWAEAVCRLLDRLGKSCILVLRGGNLPAFAARHPARVRKLLNLADRITTPSSYLQDQLKPYSQHIELIPNALDLQTYPFTLRDKPVPRLIWLRALHRVYNPALAIQVTAALRDEFPAIHLTLVGPDKRDGSREELLRLIDDLGITARVELPGGVPKHEVPTWLNRGDIFLNTTTIDNTPVSVLEAQACGLCVVSTDVGGIPYLLEDERDSLLVPSGDPIALQTAIRRILTEPGLAATLSQNAHRKVKNLDWPVVLPQWETLIDEVATARK
ncbi:MAG: glycosyltransferase family 4 protein [Anaerolineae bacterium]|nr:glycosyltransferase family 4 protein [Anaerolineae bacterium]